MGRWAVVNIADEIMHTVFIYNFLFSELFLTHARQRLVKFLSEI